MGGLVMIFAVLYVVEVLLWHFLWLWLLVAKHVAEEEFVRFTNLISLARNMTYFGQ